MYVESRIKGPGWDPKSRESRDKALLGLPAKSGRLGRAPEGVKPGRAAGQARERARHCGMGVAKRAEASVKRLNLPPLGLAFVVSHMV